MASLSEQIREIVKAQSVSTYAIAKEIGISETLMARFLSGERGLSLSSLDKLASMFGIQATVLVQQLPRPTKRGRKPKEKKMSVVLKTKFQAAIFWNNLAVSSAEDAYENNFSSRRGVYVITDAPSKSGQVICLYNNNPYSHDFKRGRSPERDRETQAFREKLAEHGVKELAYAVWPLKGDEAGYSYAMILDAGEDQKEELKGWMESILEGSDAAASGKPSIGE